MVVKIGSSTVVGADGKVNRTFIGGLADQAAALRKLGWRLVVVSSGAIACGYPVLGFDRKPVGDLPSLVTTPFNRTTIPPLVVRLYTF